MVKKGKTPEELFEEAWNEFGFQGSDIEREYKFHPLRRWRFDFAFPSRRLAIEIDGRGRHQTVVGVRKDAEKSNTGAALGWLVLHLPTSDIRARDEFGEPLIQKFISLVCDILCRRTVYDETGMGKEVAIVQTVPSPSDC